MVEPIEIDGSCYTRCTAQHYSVFFFLGEGVETMVIGSWTGPLVAQNKMSVDIKVIE